jgi:hypothetical protein
MATQAGAWTEKEACWTAQEAARQQAVLQSVLEAEEAAHQRVAFVGLQMETEQL